MQRAIVEARIKRWEYLRSVENPRELTITMHPQVWCELLHTMRAEESGLISWKEDGNCYLADMKVIQDHDAPGIEMLVRGMLID